jgi:rhodanese-related sulfurtransferase
MQQLMEFVVNHWFLTALFFSILIALFFNVFGAQFQGYRSVGITEATQVMNHDDAVILDVREDSEFGDGHILNSQHIPLSQMKKQLGSFEKYKDKPVIVVCRSGSRSASGCALLTKRGFDQVYNLRGGLMAWRSANLPIAH